MCLWQCFVTQTGWVLPITWLRINDNVTLSAACDRYIPLLGTDRLFETYGNVDLWK